MSKKYKQLFLEDLQKLSIAQLQALCEKHHATLLGRADLKSSYIDALRQIQLPNGHPLVRKPIYGSSILRDANHE